MSIFKVIKPLNYEKIFDYLWQCRIRQYCNVTLVKVEVFITFLINILVFWSIMPFRLPHRHQRVSGKSYPRLQGRPRKVLFAILQSSTRLALFVGGFVALFPAGRGCRYFCLCRKVWLLASHDIKSVGFRMMVQFQAISRGEAVMIITNFYLPRQHAISCYCPSTLISPQVQL